MKKVCSLLLILVAVSFSQVGFSYSRYKSVWYNPTYEKYHPTLATYDSACIKFDWSTSPIITIYKSTGALAFYFDGTNIRLGVGLTPTQALDVGTGNVRGTTFYFGNTTSAYLSASQLRNGGGNFTIQAEDAMIFGIDHNDDDADVRYFAWQKNNGTELARLNEYGRLALGTTAPGYWQGYFTKSLYVADTVSASVIVDRTPWFEGDALKELQGVRGTSVKDKIELDHSTLPEALRSMFKVTRFKDKTGTVQEVDFKPAATDTTYKEFYESVTGRDVGATISYLIKSVQQLADSVFVLRSKIASIEKAAAEVTPGEEIKPNLQPK